MTSGRGPGAVPRRELTALAAGLGAGLLGVSVLPVLLESQRTLGLSATTTGVIATVESLGAVAGAVIFSVRPGRAAPSALAARCLLGAALRGGPRHRRGLRADQRVRGRARPRQRREQGA